MVTKLAKERKYTEVDPETAEHTIVSSESTATPVTSAIKSSESSDVGSFNELTEDDDIKISDDDTVDSIREKVREHYGEEAVKEYDEEIKRLENEENSSKKEEKIEDSKKGITDNRATSVSRHQRIPREEKISGGFLEVPNASHKQNLLELNRSADFILSCMFPGVKEDYYTAAHDNGISDIGIYILGVLNQIYKEGSYYTPDIEPEWDNKVIGYAGELICQYCGKVIHKPANINQLYCNNTCAREANRGRTGVIKPHEKIRPTEEELDQKAFEKEITE